MPKGSSVQVDKDIPQGIMPSLYSQVKLTHMQKIQRHAWLSHKNKSLTVFYFIPLIHIYYMQSNTRLKR